MPWTELTTAPAELGLKPNGVILWNLGLQGLMGDPDWVDLLWDADARTLGIRAISSPSGLLVSKDPAQGIYKVDSAAILEAAGVSVDEITNAEPDSDYQTDRDAGPWFGHNPIYYITLPEP